MSEYVHASPAYVAKMTADMVADPRIENLWSGDTRLDREADGVITEWRIVAEHINGQRNKVEIVKAK